MFWWDVKETSILHPNHPLHHLHVMEQEALLDNYVTIPLTLKDGKFVFNYTKSEVQDYVEFAEVLGSIIDCHAAMNLNNMQTTEKVKRLEKELGVRGTINVFREALKRAKEAAAEAKR